MLITSLDVTNVLSYGQHEHIKFDSKLTVLVGPNGGGKTNILRVIAVVREVIYREIYGGDTVSRAARNEIIESMCPPHHLIPRGSEIRLGVVLANEDNAEGPPTGDLLELFLNGLRESALAQVLVTRNEPVTGVTNDPSTLHAMYNALRVGTIVLRHNRTIGAEWTIAYDFSHDGNGYRWAVSNLGARLYRGLVFLVGANGYQGAEQYKDRVTITDNLDGSIDVHFGSMIPSNTSPMSLKISPQLASHPIGSTWDALRRSSLVPGSGIAGGQETGLEYLLGRIVADKIESDFQDTLLGLPATTSMDILAQSEVPAPVLGKPTMPRYLAQLFRWSVGEAGARDRYSKAQAAYQRLKDDGSSTGLIVKATKQIKHDEVDFEPNPLAAVQPNPMKVRTRIED
ncbi:MAG: AAA family ATPase [Acidimicrobiaceae bacterium]|nr:AAA family ATPase [Acidimicrobiaceae bacterium]